jgi:hypothetical protein
MGGLQLTAQYRKKVRGGENEQARRHCGTLRDTCFGPEVSVVGNGNLTSGLRKLSAHRSKRGRDGMIVF